MGKRGPTPNPGAHLDDELSSRLRRERPGRDKCLRAAGAPNWMLGRPVEESLNERSPTVLYVAVALASPFGLSSDRVPELVALAPTLFEAPPDYASEVGRFVLLTDALVRQFAPTALGSLGMTEVAEDLRNLPAITDENSYWVMREQATIALDKLGPAVKLEARAKTLDEALRARSFGYAVVSLIQLGRVIDGQYRSTAFIPAMTEVLRKFMIVYAGTRAAATALADTQGLRLAERLVNPDPNVFAVERAKIALAATGETPRPS